MLNKHFQFEDYTQRYYSTSSYQRFYQIVAKNNQLQNLFVDARTLKKLQTASADYLKVVTAAFSSSLLFFYAFNKYINFGNGFLPKMGKTICSVSVVMAAIHFSDQKMKDSVMKLKLRVYKQNEDKLRRYELTGDVLQVEGGVRLVE